MMKMLKNDKSYENDMKGKNDGGKQIYYKFTIEIVQVASRNWDSNF